MILKIKQGRDGKPEWPEDIMNTGSTTGQCNNRLAKITSHINTSWLIHF